MKLGKSFTFLSTSLMYLISLLRFCLIVATSSLQNIDPMIVLPLLFVGKYLVVSGTDGGVKVDTWTGKFDIFRSSGSNIGWI